MSTESNNQGTEDLDIKDPIVGTESGEPENEAPVDSETVVKNELAILPFNEQAGVVKFTPSEDIVRIAEISKKVKSFKKRFSNVEKFTPTSIDDKEGEEKLAEARRELRRYRLDIGKELKDKTKPLTDTVKFYNSKYKPSVEAIELIEAPLKAIADKHEQDIEDAKQAEAKALEIRVNDRVQKLLNSGASFDSKYYSIGSDDEEVQTISLGMVDIQTMTDAIFENILSQVVEINNFLVEKQLRAAQLKKDQEKERLRKEAEEKEAFLKEQEKLKQEQEALKKEREEMDKMRREMLEQKDQLEKQRLAEEARINKEKAEAEEKLWRGRLSQLTDIGWNGQFAFDRANDKVAVFSYTALIGLSDEEFIPLRDIYNNTITARKEQQRIADEETKRLKDLKDAEDKRAEEKRIADKAIADKKLQDAEDEKKRLEELNKKGDKAVWEDFISRLKVIDFPTMKSNDYMLKVSQVEKFIIGLK